MAAVSVPLTVRTATEVAQLWVADPHQTPVPAQLQVLERWPDGSIRWLRVTFQATLTARSSETFTLRAGPPRTPASPGVRVTGPPDAPIIDTGGLRVLVRDGNDGVIAEVTTPTGFSRIPIPLPIGQDAGVPPGRPIEVRVAARGPVHAGLQFFGTDARGFRFETHLDAFAHERALRITHTIVNTTAATSTTPIRRLALTIPTTVTTAQVGIDGRARMLETVTPTREAWQLDATTAMLDGRADGLRLDGWARVETGDVSITTVRQDLWPQFPAGFTLAADGIALDLIAAPNAPLAFGVGAAKTFDAWVVIDPTAQALAPPATAEHLLAPLRVSVPPAWIVRTKALPQMIDPTSPGARDVLARLTAAIQRYVARNAKERWDDGPPVPCDQRTTERPRLGTYGVLHWGDWNFPGYRDNAEGCDAWGNLEYDLPQVLGLTALATGDPVAQAQFLAAARHYRDVDIVHHMPAHPDWVGMNHPHKMGHFAVEAPNGIDLGHTWLEGLLTHYRLTGESASRDAARAIADVLATRLDKAGNPRQYGWPLLALVAVADATGEKRYLDAARGYAESAMRTLAPTPASGDWKMGILADGLAYFDAATGDPAVRHWLVAYANAWLAEPLRWKDPRYVLPFGWLAIATHDERYRTVALHTAAQLQIGEWGKTLAVSGRTALRLLGPLAAAEPPPLPKSSPARATRQAPTADRAPLGPVPSSGPPAHLTPPAPFGPPRGLEAAPRRPSPSR